MEIKQLFSEQTSITQNLLIEKVQEANPKGTISSSESRLINEALVSLDKVLGCDFLHAHDKILLEKSYRYGSDAVHLKLSFFSNYYYSYKNISQGDIGTQQSTFIQI